MPKTLRVLSSLDLHLSQMLLLLSVVEVGENGLMGAI